MRKEDIQRAWRRALAAEGGDLAGHISTRFAQELGIEVEEEPEVVWKGMVHKADHRLMSDGQMLRAFYAGGMMIGWEECTRCGASPLPAFRALAVTRGWSNR